MIPFAFSDEEKQEVVSDIRSLGLQYQNSIVILDKSDVPEDLSDAISFADRDEDEIQESSRQLIESIRRYKA